MPEVVKDNFIQKTNLAVTSACSNTTCNGGWLRVLVQALFCIITVASFIIILHQSIQRSPTSLSPDNENEQKCFVAHCRIICSEAYFDKQYEDDLIYATEVAQYKCPSINLTLNRPSFENASLPRNWMSTAKVSIDELSIVGGNLKNISPNAFMSTFSKNLKTLEIQDVYISNWEPDMLVGLLHLKELHIRDSRIDRVHSMALRSVDSTLETLIIRTSGSWDPAPITGSSNLEKLMTVDFSSNNFSGILKSESFMELHYCKVLRLSSSQITAIEPGTFDSFVNVEMIFLNNNLLTTVPVGLFDRINAVLNPKPRIDLQNNLFHCMCQEDYVTTLVKSGILWIEPICHTPEEVRGTPISVYHSFCRKNNVNNNKFRNFENDTVVVTMNGQCNMPLSETKKDVQGRSPRDICSNISDFMNPDFVVYNRTRAVSTELIRMPFFEYRISVLKESGILYSKIDIDLWPTTDFGLIWFQTDCPENIYCIETIPAHLIIYGIELDVSYTLCPIDLSNLSIQFKHCTVFQRLLESYETKFNFFSSKRRIYLFGISLVAASFIGAIILYGIIHKNPTLISKRVLIIKNRHNDAEAIDLPPKVPLRSFPIYPVNSKCVLPSQPIFLSPNMSRQESIRSYRSNAPSYISAIQPTEEQLKEWRLKHHFLNNTIPVSDTISNIYDGDVYTSMSPLPPGSENIYGLQPSPVHLKRDSSV